MAQIILDSANNLIQGDFDTATLALRTRMQTSTTNATTGVYVVPNGSATSASVQVSNAADPTNASKVVVATNGATDTQIVSGANGSGSYLPLSFYTNNDIRFQMGNAGELNVRTAPGTVSSGTSGQFLTSGGPGAGVSWTTVTVPPSGQIQTEIFTAPGTWTKPASATQVKVTVVGGGGGGANPAGYPSVGGTGGTSSFGSICSATGGTGSGPSAPALPGTPGSGTVSSGTALRTGAVNSRDTNPGSVGPTTSFIPGFQGFIGSGRWFNGESTSGLTWSPSVASSAGASGGFPSQKIGGGGGVAVVLTPVSAPVAVTVGAGGAANNPSSTNCGATGGVVIVEYVG
jgi:hypothetical protein